MPIVFLYRHAIESGIKGILVGFGSAIGRLEKDVLKRGHNLNKQVPDLRKLAKVHGLTLSPSFEDLIKRWQSDDPIGMISRYPATKGGQDQQMRNADRFKLKEFVDSIESALDELGKLYLTFEPDEESPDH